MHTLRRLADDGETVKEYVWRVTVLHQHNARCPEMSDQQIVHPALRVWFEGLMAGGLTAVQALSVYEEAIFGGTHAGESELLTQQVCFHHCGPDSHGMTITTTYVGVSASRAPRPCRIAPHPFRSKFGQLSIG